MGLFDTLLGKNEIEESPRDIEGLYDRTIKDQEDIATVMASPKFKEAINEYQRPENVRRDHVFIFEEERRRVPDFYLPYYWLASYNMDMNNPDMAKSILKEGIERCRIKSVLCRKLAEIYFETNRLEDALYWFFTAIMAGGRDTDFHSFLYLGYIFDEYGMKEASWWARRRARGISYNYFYVAAE